MSNHDVKDFQTDVLELSKTIPVVVDFWAEWCGPCKVLGPVLEKLAEKHKGDWELKKLDTEEFPDIASEYGIQSIPNVKLFLNGEVANEFVGALPEASVEQWLQSAIPDKHSSDLDRAEGLLREHRYEEARKILEPILVSAPDHDRTRALLAVALLFSDRGRAVDLVTSIDESSNSFELAESVRSLDRLLSKLDNPSVLADSTVKEKYLGAIRRLAEGNPDLALEQFIDIIREDRYYDDDGARKACIAIFKYLGEEHEVTRNHRRDFGNALYA
jgi:putative thioredoxin